MKGNIINYKGDVRIKMISIIVPVYNVEKYLEECLESIKNQTYTDIEVILVNDGSTDNSQVICERYCQQNPRFYLINQENQGQSVARNNGVAVSKGEFITFVDSDDVIKSDMLQQLMRYMDTGIDIVECDFTEDKEIYNIKNRQLKIEEFTSSEALKKCFDMEIKWSPVAKLYRRKIVEGTPFLENLIYEDLYSGIVSLKNIEKMRKINYIGYYYRIHPRSTMRRKFDSKNLDLFKIGDSLLEKFSEDKLLPYIAKVLFLVCIAHVELYKIRPGHPYFKEYDRNLKKYLGIAKKSSEVLKSSKLLRWYNFSSKLFIIIIFPLYLKYLDIRNKINYKRDNLE